MVEIIKRHRKEPLSQCLGLPITPEAKGVRIGDRHFDSAICLIGDGTGLEALKAAKANPRTAVVVIDPFARAFAGTVYDQLESGNFRGLDWSFLTGNRQLKKAFNTISTVLEKGDAVIEKIEHEYGHLRPRMQALRQAIFLADGTTHTVAADAPVFDEIRWTYPSGSRIVKDVPALFSFLNGALRDKGAFEVATDIFPLYEMLLMIAYPVVTEHGKVTRNGHVYQPLSLYDMTNGAAGYHYIKMKKSDAFPELSALRLTIEDVRLTMAGYTVAGGAFDDKKRDIKR